MPAGPLSGGWGSTAQGRETPEQKRKRERDEQQHRNSRWYLARYDGLSTAPPLVNPAKKPAVTMSAEGSSTANSVGSDSPASGLVSERELPSNKLRAGK